MENPDPTQFISIADYKSALVLQQAEFDKITDSNAEIIEAKDSEIAELTDFKTRAEEGISAVVAAIQNTELDEQATAQTILAVITQGMQPEADRKRAEIQKQIAELQAQLS